LGVCPTSLQGISSLDPLISKTSFLKGRIKLKNYPLENAVFHIGSRAQPLQGFRDSVPKVLPLKKA